MKKFFNTMFAMIVILLVMALTANSKTVNISGYAFLENGSSHDGIRIIFERTQPTQASDTVYSKQNGLYNTTILEGIYNIYFSKSNHGPISLKGQALYDDKAIDTVMLPFIGLSGAISGVLKKGTYTVAGNLFVDEKDTLIIEPGVVLKFKEDISFNSYGMLKAIGKPNDSIIFTHYDDTTAWGGLTLNYESLNNCIIKFSIIEYSKSNGINMIGSNILLENTMVRYNAIKSPDKIGAGINFISSNAIIRNSIISCNNIGKKNKQAVGGGLYFSINSAATIENSIICYNEANQGGGVYIFASSPIFRNVLVNGNKAQTAAGIMVWQFNYTLENLTIVNNQSEAGSGICGGGNNNKVNNCIIAFNKGWGVEGSAFSNCCVFGNEPEDIRHCNEWAGINVKVNENGDSCDAFNNIFMDPKFVDWENNNFKLQAGSPCIDAGFNDTVKTPDDFLENIRIWDGNGDGKATVDFGAIEYNSEPLKGLVPVLDTDFEDGITGWNVKSENTSSNWEIRNDQKEAYDGTKCLIMKSSSAGKVYLISPEIVLPDTGSTYIMFHSKLKAEASIIDKIKSGILLSDKAILRILVSETGSDISDFKEIGNNINIISSEWEKFITGLSSYAGKKVYIAFEVEFAENSSFYLDNISIKSTGLVSYVESSQNENNFALFPNPAQDKLFISGFKENFFIKIYDILGNLRYDKFFYEQNKIIDLSKFENGMYIININSGRDFYIEKFLIQK